MGPGDIQDFNFTNRITGDGEKITINYELQNDSIYTVEGDIEKWEDSDFIYVFTDDNKIIWRFHLTG